MKKKLLTMMCIMLLLVTATGCSSNSNKSDTDSKSTTSSIFSKKEDKYSVESIEKKNFKEAKNIPADDNFDINADRLTGKFCQRIAETYHTKYNWENSFISTPSINNIPSGIQYYCQFFQNESAVTEGTGDMLNKNLTHASISVLRFKETLSYLDAKQEFKYLKNNIIKYFGEEAFNDHSNEANWAAQYDSDAEIFGIKLSKAKSTKYKLSDDDYQLDFTFNIYALKQKFQNVNTDRIKKGFIWLGLDKYYNSEYKCIDAFKMTYTVPWSVIATQELDAAKDEDCELIDEETEYIQSFPILSMSKLLENNQETSFIYNSCFLL